MKFTSRKRISFVLTAAIFAAFTALFALLGITTRTIAKNEGGGVAGAAEDYTPYLTFSVSPDTYLSGTPVAYYPKITVTLTADANVISNYLSNISLLYLEVSSENGMYTPEQFRAVDPAAFSSAGRGLDLWVLPSGGGKAFCEIDTAEISGNTASYKSYIYFKTQYLDGTAVVGEEFQSGGYIEFGVYTHTEQNYAITGITTYYTSPDVPLTLYNDNDVWIGSEAVFTVETANNDLPVNVFFAITHELDQYGNEILDDAHLVWHNSNGGVYRPGLPARTAERTIILNGDVLRAITSEIAQSVAGGAGQNSEDGYGYGAFDGTIHFKVMDKPQMFSQLGSPMIIKIDTAEPEFTVSAFKTDAVNNVTNQMYDLEAKGWSDSHIQVKLIPGAVDANIPQFYRGAPLKYFFSASNDTQGDAIYTAFETGTDEYVKLITETTLSFSFKAESLTGRYRTSETYSVNIDTVNPSVSLTSTDKIGHIVLSALIPATSSNQISGYASQFLSVIASNGVQNTAPLSFYYTVDGGAPIALQKTIGASNLWNSVPVQFLPDISNPRKDFVFTIESATGLKSSALLRVTVIPDAVYKNMPGNRDFNAEIKYENPPPQITGWSADMLTLFVSVESFLTSNEYLGYSIDAGGEYDLTVLSGTQVLDRTVTYLNMTTVPDTEIKIKHYSIQIKDSINNAHISLKVTNRAGASYTVVNTPEAYRVDLQLEIAGYNAVTVTKRIGTGAIVLGPDDWSKGRVNIELVPAFHTGYSGIRVYYALPDPADSTHTQFVKGSELFLVNGKYTYEAKNSGDYYFILESGAMHAATGNTPAHLASSPVSPPIMVSVQIEKESVILDTLSPFNAQAYYLPYVHTGANSYRYDPENDPKNPDDDYYIVGSYGEKVYLPYTGLDSTSKSYLISGSSVGTLPGNITLTFNVNQAGGRVHLFESSNGVLGAETVATLYFNGYKLPGNADTPSFLTIPIPTGSSGQKTFYFYIESLAKDENGATSVSPTKNQNGEQQYRQLVVTYNSTGVSLEISAGHNGASFTADPVFFTIFGVNSISSDSLNLARIEYRLLPAEGSTVGKATDWLEFNVYSEHWTSVNFNAGLTSTAQGYFKGYTVAGGSVFNGFVEFRGYNVYGRGTDTIISQLVKVDTTTPDPLKGLYLQNDAGLPIEKMLKSAGALDTDDGTVIYDVYSIDRPNILRTFGKANETGNGIDINYAPITYEIRTALIDEPLAMTNSSYNLNTVESGIYKITAKSDLKSSTSVTIKINKDINTPKATLTAQDANPNGQNVLETAWLSYAVANIRSSQNLLGSGVYFEFGIVRGTETEWHEIKLNPLSESSVLDGTQPGVTLYFRYDDSAAAMDDDPSNDPVYIGRPTGSFLINLAKYGISGKGAYIKFRAYNRAGNLFEFPAARNGLILNLDAEMPDFNIALSYLSTPGSLLEEAREAVVVHNDTNVGWWAGALFLEIKQTNTIPGGVKYSYNLAPYASDELPSFGYNYDYPDKNLPGSGFTPVTTDTLLAAFGYTSGNGKYLLKITAQLIQGSGSPYSIFIIIGIDKGAPAFEIIGSLSNGTHIASGSWTNTHEGVFIAVENTEQPSGLVYKYRKTNDANFADWNGELKKFDHNIDNGFVDIIVRAISGAGKYTDIIYKVRIDVVPPVINSGIIANKIKDDGTIEIDDPDTFYIDQSVTYIEVNLKRALYNNFPLANGQIISTNTVDNSAKSANAKQEINKGKGGYVHLVVEDLAGNRSELYFFMTMFELTVNDITLASEDQNRLNQYAQQFENAISLGARLEGARVQYFENNIRSLRDRIETLRRQNQDFQAFLEEINSKSDFSLVNDFPRMETHYLYFTSPDVLIRYPKWQQDMIIEGKYATYYQKLVSEYTRLYKEAESVRSLERSVVALHAVNVTTRDDYPNIMACYNNYTKLYTRQKEIFSSNLYTKLMEVKKQCELMLLRDIDNTTYIEGDSIPQGVAIEPVTYALSSEIAVNAQTLLLSTFPESVPRDIVYVRKVSYTELGAAYNVGEVTLHLNIPAEFKNYTGDSGQIDGVKPPDGTIDPALSGNYKRFAVYRLSSDGTITPITDYQIDALGKYVYFKTSSLDTYILCVDGSLKIAPPPVESYGSVGDIEIDATMLMYIGFIGGGVLVIAVVALIIVGIRHRKFTQKYDRSHKSSLAKRGIHALPKGNPLPRTNPADATKLFDYDK